MSSVTQRAPCVAPDPDAAIAAVLPALYEAALDPDPVAWDKVLAIIAHGLRADAASIVTVDKVIGQTLRLRQVDAAGRPMLNFRFLPENDRIYQRSLQEPDDTVVLGPEFLSRQETRETWTYREVMAPNGLEWWVAARFENTPLIFSIVGVFRAADRGDFGVAERAILEQLVPHLRSAVRVSRRLGQASAANRASLATLQFSRYGIALLDNAGRLLFLNEEARRITGSKDGVVARGRRLDVGSTAERQKLRAFVASQSTRLHLGGPPAELRLRVARPSGKLAYEVLTVVLEQSWSDAGYFPNGSAFLVLVSDPTEVFSVSRRLLIDTFGLSVNQARLCQALVRTGSLEDAAREMGIRPHSARTHLRRTFAKLGVSSQLELVLLLGATIRGPEGAEQAPDGRSR